MLGCLMCALEPGLEIFCGGCGDGPRCGNAPFGIGGEAEPMWLNCGCPWRWWAMVGWGGDRDSRGMSSPSSSSSSLLPSFLSMKSSGPLCS